MQTEAFIAVGSNIDPDRNIVAAMERLVEVASIRAVSTFYRVRPLDRPNQPDYRNGAIRIATESDPSTLHWRILRAIERELGRKRTQDKHAARTIDLDLVMYGDLEYRDGDLQLPDPDIVQRNFLAVPLAELAPEVELPGDGRTLAEVATELGAAGLAEDVPLTHTLREMLANEHKAR